MTRSVSSWAGIAVALLLLARDAAERAGAAELEKAKASGHAGERYDGYLGLVDPKVPESVKRLVDDINARRREKYAQVAEQTGAKVEEVAAVAGKKLVERARPGEFVMPAKGRWVKR